MPPTTAASTFSTISISGQATVNNIGGDFNIAGDYNAYGTDAAKEQEVCRWLAAPDISRNYHAARETHHAQTGSWFICGEAFLRWKELPDNPLWVYESPGCGKTIICSTVIEDMIRHCDDQPASACAYFFFDGRNADSELSVHEKLIRSVIQQLWDRLDGIPEALMGIYGRERSHHQPSLTALQNALHAMIEYFEHAYIIIDALDECADIENLLLWVRNMSCWKSGKLHLLLSSRQERAVEDHLAQIGSLKCVRFAGGSANPDIGQYVNGRVSKIMRWDPETKEIVTDALFEGADGSFRWVALQLAELERCTNLRTLNQQLRALPKDLEKTYERMLCKSSKPDDLKTFLQWVALSARPVTLQELAETVTIDFQGHQPNFDPNLRYMDLRDILTVCAGFLTEFQGIIKLAHMTVKDYLLSESISGGAAAYFKINARMAHSLIAEICLAYLLRFGTLRSLSYSSVQYYPLARYAAEHWIFHFHEHNGRLPSASLQMLLLHFSHSEPTSYLNWIWLIHTRHYWLGDQGKIWQTLDLKQLAGENATPLYLAAFLGLHNVVHCLLWHKTSFFASAEDDKWHIKAIQGAAYKGRLEIVKLLACPEPPFMDLVEKYAVTALAVAAGRGHVEIVKYLLARGVDANSAIPNWHGEPPWEGRDGIVQLLLDHGADADALDIHHDGETAFIRASSGHERIPRWLIENGADANAQNTQGVAVLAWAAWEGHKDVVRLLLEYGANGGATALLHAAWQGHQDVARLLLENGVNVDARTTDGDTALIYALQGGRQDVVRLLLENHADANTRAAGGDTALIYAVRDDQQDVVRLLLENDADVNARAADGDTALICAVWRGRQDVMRFLLENRADVNAQTAHGDTALICAVWGGCQPDVIRMLLENDADVNARNAHGNTALICAVWGGCQDVMRLLLKNRADVNAQTAHGDTALMSAVRGGRQDVVRLLLESHADVNARAANGETALIYARQGGRQDILRLLIEKNSDDNTRDAIVCAVKRREATIARLLLL